MSKTLLLLALALAAVAAVASAPPRGKVTLPPNDPRHKADHQLVLPIPHVVDLKAEFFGQYLRPTRARTYRYWLVVFYTTWCDACDDLVAPLVELSDRLSHRKAELTLGKHNASPNEAVAHQYGIDAFPTVVLFDKENGADGAPKWSVFHGEKRTTEELAAFVKLQTGIELGAPKPDGTAMRQVRKEAHEKRGM